MTNLPKIIYLFWNWIVNVSLACQIWGVREYGVQESANCGRSSETPCWIYLQATDLLLVHLKPIVSIVQGRTLIARCSSITSYNLVSEQPSFFNMTKKINLEVAHYWSLLLPVSATKTISKQFWLGSSGPFKQCLQWNKSATININVRFNNVKDAYAEYPPLQQWIWIDECLTAGGENTYAFQHLHKDKHKKMGKLQGVWFQPWAKKH